VLELAPDQVEPIRALARAAGLPVVQVHQDLAGRDRVLVARRADPAG
jgi:methylase of polypeptide subunit release factors